MCTQQAVDTLANQLKLLGFDVLALWSVLSSLAHRGGLAW